MNLKDIIARIREAENDPMVRNYARSLMRIVEEHESREITIEVAKANEQGGVFDGIEKEVEGC